VNSALRLPHQVAVAKPTARIGGSGSLSQALGLLRARNGMGTTAPGSYGGNVPFQRQPFALSRPGGTPSISPLSRLVR